MNIIETMFPYISLIRWIIKYLSRKRICILGESAVGKTMMFNYLSTGIIHQNYHPTTHSITVKGRSIRLKDLNLFIADSMDVTGTGHGWDEWEKSYRNSDYVIYMFRADLVFPSSLEDVVGNFRTNPKVDGKKFSQFIELFNGYIDSIQTQSKRLTKDSSADIIQELSACYEEYRNEHIGRLNVDIQQIKEWYNAQAKPIVFVGTHGDFIPKFDYLNSKKKGYLYDTLRDELYERVPKLSMEDRTYMIVGSFTNEVEVGYYVYELFKMLKGRAMAAKKETGRRT